MSKPRITFRSRYQGEALVEALLIGPIVAVILVLAVNVGHHFYSFAVSQSISYTNSVTYSSNGAGWSSFAPANYNLRYWDGAEVQIANPTSITGAPDVFSNHCLSAYEVFSSNLGYLDNSKPNGNWLLNLFVYSTSIAFRPLYGGDSPACVSGVQDMFLPVNGEPVIP